MTWIPESLSSPSTEVLKDKILKFKLSTWISFLIKSQSRRSTDQSSSSQQFFINWTPIAPPLTTKNQLDLQIRAKIIRLPATCSLSTICQISMFSTPGWCIWRAFSKKCSQLKDQNRYYLKRSTFWLSTSTLEKPMETISSEWLDSRLWLVQRVLWIFRKEIH